MKDSHERPLLENNKNTEFIAGLMEARREKYQAAADIIVATDGKTELEICEELVKEAAGSGQKEGEKYGKENIRYTGLMGLFGSPVGHSASPEMYNFCFQHDGLDYAYLGF